MKPSEQQQAERFVWRAGDFRAAKNGGVKITLKHLPGRHDQQLHGRGWSGGRGRRRDDRGRFSGSGGTGGESRLAKPSRAWNGEGVPKPGQRVNLRDSGDGEVLRYNEESHILVVKLDSGSDARVSMRRSADRVGKPKRDTPAEVPLASDRPPQPPAPSLALSPDAYDNPLEGKAAYESASKPTSPDGHAAMEAYQRTEHVSINNLLRRDAEPATGSREKVQRLIDDLDAAFEEAPTLDRAMKVHRGVNNLDAFIGPMRTRNGQSFIDHGFASTTADPAVMDERFSGEGRLEIVIPAGGKALRGRNSLVQGLDEQELLLPRGTTFKILEDDIEDYYDESIGGVERERRVVRLEVVL